MKIPSLITALLLGALPVAEAQIKVACVGNSITYGSAVENREKNAYPVQLQNLLGSEYEVGNFGKPGATLLRKGHRPYNEQKEYEQAIAFKPDIAVIHLGVNDTDPRNWPNYRDFFIQDYLDLIESFRKVNPDTEFYIAKISPISDRHPRFNSGTKQWHAQIQEAIATVAKLSGAKLIDFHKPLYDKPNLIPDGVHPNAAGATILAQTVYKALSGDYGGLQMPMLYTDNMMFQHGETLPISGIANAGEKVVVKLGKKSKVAYANHLGEWHVVLPAFKPGTDYTLSITSGDQKKVYQNIAIGEVWLCSGQSNMAFMLKQSLEKGSISKEDVSKIRLFNMTPRYYTNHISWSKGALDSINNLQYYNTTQWEKCNDKNIQDFSAVALHFGKMLQDSLNVPVGLINNSIGGSTTESWIDRKTLEDKFYGILPNWLNNDFVQDWARGRARKNIANSTDKLQRHPYQHCYLFETGIAPLEQFPIKGVIWYQGESNAHNVEAHEELFKLLVESWRKEWNNQELPFYYVQLSSLNRPSWTWFRDSQRRLMKEIPHTAMAVSSDRGDSLDVHPRAKQDVGQRLARWALSNDYNIAITPSGPLFKSVSQNRNSLVVEFDYNEGMCPSSQEEIIGFEVAAVDGQFYPAQAEVTKDNKIIVKAKGVKKPRFVRYGWQPFTRANLVNNQQLPASTFRAEIDL